MTGNHFILLETPNKLCSVVRHTPRHDGTGYKQAFHK